MQRCQPWAMLVGTIFALTCGIARSQPLAPSSATSPSAAVRGVLREFDTWASVQRLYEADQVKKFRAKIVEKAGQLSGDDLQAFLDDLSDRLHVLTSADARDARRWLSQTLAVASDS